jgi:DNA end-binding protein Ku
MPKHAYWSGQIRISLVALGVSLTPATKRSSQLPLHELQCKTEERIHHRNVLEDRTPVDDSEIIKGFEYAKAEYVLLEPEDLNNIKLPSGDLPVIRLERPYFVTPNGKKDLEIYHVLAEALRASGKAGIGQIALRGREELCAVLPFEDGLLLATLRYDIELQDPPDIYGRGARKSKGEYLTLAKRLIDENSGAPTFSRYHDHYHEALKQLVDAKRHHRKPTARSSTTKPAKVVNFMDALKRSLKEGKRSPSKNAAKTVAKRKPILKKVAHRHAA